MNRPWDRHRSIADRKLVATSLNESFTAAIGCPLVPKNPKKMVHIFFEHSGHLAGYPAGHLAGHPAGRPAGHPAGYLAEYPE